MAAIQQSLAAGRYRVLAHFAQRMDERSLFWSDVLAVFDSPAEVRGQGLDQYERPKWVVGGRAADGLPLEIGCVLDVDDRGNVVVFITIY